jgi:outer membrane protein assembly factor BamB
VPGAPDAAYVIGSDGYVRGLNVQSGWETMTPLQLLPANTRAAGPIVVNDDSSGFLYVTTTQGCAYTPDAVWAVDLTSQKKDVVSWEAKGATIAGNTGPAFSKDGTVFVATADGSSPLSNAIVALEGKTLKQKAAFTMAKADFASSPIVFPHNDKELIAAASRDGRVFVLDAGALKVPLAVTPASGETTGEGLASWQDDKSTRWIFAASSTGVTAYKLVPEGGGLALQRAWATPAITSPLTPMVVNGVVFVASGEARAPKGAARAPRSLPSVLYAFDAATGKELWTSGKTITTTAKSGLSAGAGVVYVPTTDATLYAFGFPIEK